MADPEGIIFTAGRDRRRITAAEFHRSIVESYDVTALRDSALELLDGVLRLTRLNVEERTETTRWEREVKAWAVQLNDRLASSQRQLMAQREIP